jgi:hypothetical protein
MKKEVEVLEAEAARGASPNDESTELIRELSDMRGRLSGIGNRTRLIKAVVSGKQWANPEGTEVDSQAHRAGTRDAEPRVKSEITTTNGVDGASVGVHGVVDMDRRIAQLEKLIGSSGTSLDEVCALSQLFGEFC